MRLPSSRSWCPACRRSSTGFGSRTSRTSISACRRAAAARSSAPSSGRRSAGRISCASPATCSRNPRGESRLRALVERLPRPAYAVLGNHDYAIARDPQARPSNLRELEPAHLLLDEGELLELRGCSVWIAGSDPRGLLRRRAVTEPNCSRTRRTSASCSATSPRARPAPAGALRARPRGSHARRSDRLPYPGGKVRLAHPRARYARGVYRNAASVMHVSPGLGTTLVPFRFAARPEATELVLRSPS